MRILLLLTLAQIFSGALIAQNKTVTGIVVNENGKPVKNVRISVLFTRIQEKTDKNGVFTIKKVEAGDSIQVFPDKTHYAQFLLGDNNKLTMQLSADFLRVKDERDEIKTFPFQTLTADNRMRIGALITARMIERSNSLYLVDALKEFVPGIQISPNESGEITASIRGSRTLNVSTEPLVILNGVESNLNHANQNVNVQDIETIEVHKDGLGYGLKGANGVIIVKTKR